MATTVMGRPMPWGWPLTLVVHLAVCIMYMWVIANAVYRFRLLPAILMGVVTGAGLYALNYVFFAGLGHDFALSHAQAIPSHLALGLFGASMYKALSVPPPMADDSGDTLHPERLDEPVMNSRSPFIQRPSR